MRELFLLITYVVVVLLIYQKLHREEISQAIPKALAPERAQDRNRAAALPP